MKAAVVIFLVVTIHVLIDRFILIWMTYIAKYNLQTNILVYIYVNYDNTNITKDGTNWVNPYFHCGPFCGSMI